MIDQNFLFDPSLLSNILRHAVWTIVENMAIDRFRSGHGPYG